MQILTARSVWCGSRVLHNRCDSCDIGVESRCPAIGMRFNPSLAAGRPVLRDAGAQPGTKALKALLDPVEGPYRGRLHDAEQGRIMDAHHRLIWALFTEAAADYSVLPLPALMGSQSSA
jgi:hypothetical protein